ncbi:MAG: methylated-DNA--[protein]-cysteine S-methyltransferase [Rhodocyclaceae bacterium]|nr:methylated-DNA--[protein]-cysteine S-methyltransferase [Rhodocyclaceae bacterium]MCB1912796.1 methylated-DNA--[protein]-cysteine S-methyltransferase [Rhodocyclaceae bacterium]MCW5617274.1 methylated-DNA--[protein]-cysteine S-methyltransferase [Rhodocyclaceae bacterium]
MTPKDIDPSFSVVVPAPFGALGVSSDDLVIRSIVFLPPGTPALAPRSALAEEARRQILAYLADPYCRFTLPLGISGSAFQRRVWAEIARIPAGELQRYGDLARRLGSAARAVGQACGANPYPLVVPCHRVVSASGLGGFANSTGGFLLDTKRWLLAHEAAPLPLLP